MAKREVNAAFGSLKELLSGDADFVREAVREYLQDVLEEEMTAALGAAKGERSMVRLGYRSGYYERALVTRVGRLELRVPQDRDGRFSTALFERYQRSETLAFYRLPRQHHKHLKSTNMLERYNQEIKRRTHIVRVFPNGESCLRLIRALAVETHEDRNLSTTLRHRRFLFTDSFLLLWKWRVG